MGGFVDEQTLSTGRGELPLPEGERGLTEIVAQPSYFFGASLK
jgi:hypothetical protein